MDFANDTKLLAAFPMVSAFSGKPDGFYVLVERADTEDDRYVTAWVRELTATSWSWGNYFPGAQEAMADALERAGWRGVVQEHLLV
jgi:hypothetical protein